MFQNGTSDLRHYNLNLLQLNNLNLLLEIQMSPHYTPLMFMLDMLITFALGYVVGHAIGVAFG